MTAPSLSSTLDGTDNELRLHAPIVLPPEKIHRHTLMGVWMCPTVGLDAEECRRVSFPFREHIPGRPAGRYTT
jgi:hypothetical protein